MKNVQHLLFCLLLVAVMAPVHGADPLARAISEQRAADSKAIASQKRVEALDDEAREMLEAYRQVNQELERLQQQNAHQQRLVTAQAEELRQISRELETLEATRRDIEPLMTQMLQVLERFIALDTPFLAQERKARLAGMQDLLGSTDDSLPDKYRRLLEAYQIEAEYGRSIEAYQAELPGDADGRMVEFLRLGRVALYYLTLDGREAGIWDVTGRRWVVLDPAFNQDIARAMRIARKQLPPDLMPLPLFGATQGVGR